MSVSDEDGGSRQSLFCEFENQLTFPETIG